MLSVTTYLFSYPLEIGGFYYWFKSYSVVVCHSECSYVRVCIHTYALQCLDLLLMRQVHFFLPSPSIMLTWCKCLFLPCYAYNFFLSFSWCLISIFICIVLHLGNNTLRVIFHSSCISCSILLHFFLFLIKCLMHESFKRQSLFVQYSESLHVW